MLSAKVVSEVRPTWSAKMNMTPSHAMGERRRGDQSSLVRSSMRALDRSTVPSPAPYHTFETPPVVR